MIKTNDLFKTMFPNVRILGNDCMAIPVEPESINR